MADDLDKNPAKTLQHNQALYRMQQIQKENAAVQAQRAKAPGALQAGSFEEQQVRAQAAQDEQSAYLAGGYSQKGSSKDSFAASREAALKSGKFDYSAVRSSFYSPPETFVTSKGARVSRVVQSEPTQSMPQPEKIVTRTPTPTVTPTNVLTAKQPVTQISQAQLAKTNALRAAQGLPPLEQVTSVQVVKPTQSQPITRLTAKGAPPDLRLQLAQKQGSLQPSQGNEAVSFLKIPFVGQKAAGTKEVPSTTILDPLQFFVGGAVTLAAKAGSFVGSLIKSEGKTIVKEGSKDIGLGVKASEDYLRAVQFTKQVKTLPKPESMIKPQAPTPTPTIKFTETATNLGIGTGKTVSKGGEGGLSTITKPTIPPTTPKPTGKEVSSGKGLIQIVKEKPALQQTKVAKPEFEMKQALKQQQYLNREPKLITQQKPKTLPKTQAQLQTEKYIQELKTKQKLRTPQEQSFVYARPEPTKTIQRTPFPVLQKPKEKQRQIAVTKPIPKQKPKEELVPIFTTLTTPTITHKTIPTPRPYPTPTITTLLIPTPTPTIPPPTKPTTPPPKPTPEQPSETKKRGGLFPGLLGAQSGALGRVSKSGARKQYIGNVPLTGIVGIYKRSEVTYGNPSNKLTRKESTQNKSNYGKLSLLGSKKIKF